MQQEAEKNLDTKRKRYLIAWRTRFFGKIARPEELRDMEDYKGKRITRREYYERRQAHKKIFYALYKEAVDLENESISCQYSKLNPSEEAFNRLLPEEHRNFDIL